MQQMHIVGERCPDKHTALQSLALRRAVHRFVKERGSPLQRETDLAIFWDLLQREDNSEDFLDLQDIMRKNKLNLAHDLSTHENQYSAPLQGSHIRSNSTSNTSNTSNIQTYDVSSTPLSDLGREKTVNLDLRGLKDFQDLQEILGDKIKVEHPYPPSSQRSKIKSNNASNTTPGLKENYFCEENPIKATSPAGDLETKLSSKQHGGGDSKPQSITHRDTLPELPPRPSKSRFYSTQVTRTDTKDPSDDPSEEARMEPDGRSREKDTLDRDGKGWSSDKGVGIDIDTDRDIDIDRDNDKERDRGRNRNRNRDRDRCIDIDRNEDVDEVKAKSPIIYIDVSRSESQSSIHLNTECFRDSLSTASLDLREKEPGGCELSVLIGDADTDNSDDDSAAGT